MRRIGPGLAGCITLMLLGHAHAETGAASDAGAWRPVAGTWSITGHRTAVEVETGAKAVIVEFSGAVTLSSGEGLSRGFQGRALGYDDGQGTSLGRCVWTDENGDHLFSRLQGEPLESGKRITGTITGGTGRYAGVEGEFTFDWQYLITDQDELMQGRTANLNGRFRRMEVPK